MSMINDKKIGKQKKDKVNRIIWDNITLSPGENVIRVEGKSGKEILMILVYGHLNKLLDSYENL